MQRRDAWKFAVPALVALAFGVGVVSWLLKKESPLVAADMSETEMQQTLAGLALHSTVAGDFNPSNAPTKGNDSDAFKRKVAAAMKGDAAAEYEVGLHYGLKYDYGTACQLFALSARQGYVHAEAALGICYMDGLGGLKENLKEARRLLLKAAAEGDPKAGAELDKLNARIQN